MVFELCKVTLLLFSAAVVVEFEFIPEKNSYMVKARYLFSYCLYINNRFIKQIENCIFSRKINDKYEFSSSIYIRIDGRCDDDVGMPLLYKIAE